MDLDDVERVPKKSIAETVREILVDIFRKCVTSGSFVLVMDERTMPVLQRAMTKFELMSEGCGVVENLNNDRAQMADAEVIYFIEPNKKNIEALLKDYDTVSATFKPESCCDKLIYWGDITIPSVRANKYGRVHLLFQGGLNDQFFAQIKANKVLLEHLVSLKEVNMDFQVIERNVFSLGQADAVEHLWGTKGHSDGIIRAIARQLMNLCVTMNEYPFIRYRQGYPCQQIALAFQNEIDNYQRLHEKWQFNPDRATVFIVDRTNDVIAPFLHEFSYQAMIYDLLTISNDTYKYSAETGKGNVDKTVILQDADPMWRKYKHMYIHETQRQLQAELKEFMEEHKAFTMLQNGQKDMLDLETLNKTVAGLPEYQANISVFSRHINIAKHCMSVFTKEKLQAVALIEQTLATGFDQDKRPVKATQIFKDLQMRFADPDMTTFCKVRLLALFLITQEGIKEEWRRKLIDIGKIETAWESALGNLRLLGIKTLVDKANVKRSTYVAKPNIQRGEEFLLSRFTPMIKDMLVGEIERTLNQDEYPYIVEPPPKAVKTPSKSHLSTMSVANTSSAAAASKTQAQSRRTKKAAPAVVSNNWAAKPSGMDDKFKSASPTPKFEGPRVILFIAGGMTYSEIRMAAEVEKELQTSEILLGSTHIITPNSFVENLKKLDPDLKFDMDS